MPDFADTLIDWQHQHGRHDLPWQRTRDPYRVWLSEIMLQQTQVTTVIPYFERFIARFPDVASLAAAPIEDVMPLWAGLGYYARARNLHRAAGLVMSRFGGRFPETAEHLMALPGVGRSTAAAIAAFCFRARGAILDGNVKRVLARAFAIEGFPGEKAVENRLWALAESVLPTHSIDTYTQALMDLGATVCTRSKPACPRCPLQAQCQAHAQNKVAQLPSPRPKKTPRHKSQHYLVLRAQDHIALLRRPPSGIWGGLMCLPEWDAQSDLAAHLAQHWQLTLERHTALAPFTHSFTHFDLELRPVLCEVRPHPDLTSPPHAHWVSVADLANLALPAPIKKLLTQLTAAA